MRCLVFQPYRHTYPDSLLAVGADLLAAMLRRNPRWRFDVVRQPMTVAVSDGSPKYAPHAQVRNILLDRFLRPIHQRVLWIDADLISYPPDLPTQLERANPGGITAPLVLLDKHDTRFYDIGGFIYNGEPARYTPPYFGTGDEPIVTMDSVGCVYLAPAALYRSGVRYVPNGPHYGVEHWSVCQAAIQRGIPVRAVRGLTAVHAWLPDFGLPLH
jgi:hypothetical protein